MIQGQFHSQKSAIPPPPPPYLPPHPTDDLKFLSSTLKLSIVFSFARRRSDRNWAWWGIHLRKAFWRRNPRWSETHWSRNSLHGQQRTRFQRKPVLYYASSNAGIVGFFCFPYFERRRRRKQRRRCEKRQRNEHITAYSLIFGSIMWLFVLLLPIPRIIVVGQKARHLRSRFFWNARRSSNGTRWDWQRG